MASRKNKNKNKKKATDGDTSPRSEIAEQVQPLAPENPTTPAGAGPEEPRLFEGQKTPQPAPDEPRTFEERTPPEPTTPSEQVGSGSGNYESKVLYNDVIASDAEITREEMPDSASPVEAPMDWLRSIFCCVSRK